MHRNCPKQDDLFGYVTVPEEFKFFKRMMMKRHLSSCGTCRKQVTLLTSSWESIFRPEVDINSSLVKVFSRLQNDETLILKGWKLGESVKRRQHTPATSYAWMWGGAIAASLAVVMTFVTWDKWSAPKDRSALDASASLAPVSSTSFPFAEIRIEDKELNRVQVHFVQPQLLKTVEFETTNGRLGR